ncbi:hypothetical protein J8F10_20940 [Gemmata sp. G18]|uniref:SWIM-type domain-containing protein n=1 Tax=Gemmata palustris TaxID=2822762 RepID=A0ABS5BWV5_9BACT|nr:hypothetical protein [Gemmata palustris]MBP3957725.1 hypothetical protein [Gemmata palustris]
MNQFTELLPVTKSEKHGALVWEPSTDNEFSPVAGVLTLTSKRCHCQYTIQEFTADHGRGFMLFKMGAGSDTSAERYGVFCGRDGSKLCECKGFISTGRCKHADAVELLITNGKL